MFVLVLVSFGLVLLATILLIVGLFNDTLGLIYLSIGASVAAAIVLFLAFRMAKPKADKSKTPPTPLDIGDAEPAPAGSEGTDAPAVAVVADDVSVTDDATAVQPAVAAAAADDWMEDDDWDDSVVDFPIADYDDLTVAEIMPLLPQLYSDELDTVIEREKAGRNRSTILKRLDELKVSGTVADMEDLGEEVPPVPAPAAAGPEAVAPLADLDDADEDGEDEWFPIADYDSLSVAQIAPLLGQLEPDELEDVKAREASGSARKTVLAEIDRLLDGAGTSAASAAAAQTRAAPTHRESGGLPIADYDELTVADIRPRLGDLSDEQLEAVLAHERSTGGRTSIIGEIERRLGAAASAGNAPVRRSDSKPAKKATKSAKKASKATKTAKKATKRAKKASRPRFPIANYDELTVADIRPRLSDLSEGQLEQVRDRELAGAGRKTILQEIDSRLG